MEIKIIRGKESDALDLGSGFSMEIEDTNPIYNEAGSQSLPATVPMTRRNIRALNAPHRIENADDPNLPEAEVRVSDGAYIRTGKINITEAGRAEGYSFNVGFDNSTAYQKWQNRKLRDLSNLPVWTPGGSGYFSSGTSAALYRLYTTGDRERSDLAIFPVVVNKEDLNGQTYYEVLNVPNAGNFNQPLEVTRIIDGEATRVTVPGGYMLSPFIRVHKVLEFIFSDLGLRIQGNPFLQDRNLRMLVVLNNAADACCRGSIKYSDLMPDSTVEEFLNALWVRFGLVYNIDYDKGTVRMMLIRDIIEQYPENRLGLYAAGHEKIVYEEKQYVRLSASTSIEGAEPATERFEDFVKNMDISRLRFGVNVASWDNQGTPDDPQWEGDGYWDWDYDDPDDPIYPDPEDWDDWPDDDIWGDIPDPDDRDPDDRDYTRARSAESGAGDDNESFLAYEYITGKWWRLDNYNGNTQESGSSFFCWDPQPEGLTALELSSDDECVPIGKYHMHSGEGITSDDSCPLYLVGSRHFHSYIKGSNGGEEENVDTPLAFMFAFNVGGKTIGRNSPENENGVRYLLDDGTRPEYSLLFQFADGLFAKFWKDYDEILRHGNRSVEVAVRIPKPTLRNIDLLDVHTFRGVRCLVDTMSYTLPAGSNVAVDLKLRIIQTQGDYDIVEEQGIPSFPIGRMLKWRAYRTNLSVELSTPEMEDDAAQDFIALNNYEPHGPEGGRFLVNRQGVMARDIIPIGTDWTNDPLLADPLKSTDRKTREYEAEICYDIYEVLETEDQNGDFHYEVVGSPLGTVRKRVKYKVWLYPEWVL